MKTDNQALDKLVSQCAGRASIRAVSAPWHRGVEFMVKCGNYYGVAVKMQNDDSNGSIRRDPTFVLETEQAQTLMDDLWNAGLRPTEGTGSAGAMAATQRHLDDMRKLVFESKIGA